MLRYWIQRHDGSIRIVDIAMDEHIAFLLSFYVLQKPRCLGVAVVCGSGYIGSFCHRADFRMLWEGFLSTN